MNLTHQVFFFFGGAGAATDATPERGVSMVRTKRIAVFRSDRIAAMSSDRITQFPSGRVSGLPAIKRISIHEAD